MLSVFAFRVIGRLPFLLIFGFSALLRAAGERYIFRCWGHAIAEIIVMPLCHARCSVYYFPHVIRLYFRHCLSPENQSGYHGFRAMIFFTISTPPSCLLFLSVSLCLRRRELLSLPRAITYTPDIIMMLSRFVFVIAFFITLHFSWALLRFFIICRRYATSAMPDIWAPVWYAIRSPRLFILRRRAPVVARWCRCYTSFRVSSAWYAMPAFRRHRSHTLFVQLAHPFALFRDDADIFFAFTSSMVRKPCQMRDALLYSYYIIIYIILLIFVRQPLIFQTLHFHYFFFFAHSISFTMPVSFHYARLHTISCHYIAFTIGLLRLLRHSMPFYREREH